MHFNTTRFIDNWTTIIQRNFDLFCAKSSFGKGISEIIVIKISTWHAQKKLCLFLFGKSASTYFRRVDNSNVVPTFMEYIMFELSLKTYYQYSASYLYDLAYILIVHGSACTHSPLFFNMTFFKWYTMNILFSFFASSLNFLYFST